MTRCRSLIDWLKRWSDCDCLLAETDAFARITLLDRQMMRDQETLSVLLDSTSRFVRERLIPNEDIVAETDARNMIRAAEA